MDNVYYNDAKLDINGKKFIITHGDGLLSWDHGYRILKRVIRSKLFIWLLRWLHPTLTYKLAKFISRSGYEDSSSMDNRKDDILYWPSKKDTIDIRDYLLEILLVEVPFRKLCSTDCKGICIECGSNRNDESCLCKKNK